MKKLLYIVAALSLVACSKSIEERAAQESEEYNKKVCPTPYINDCRTDSTSFDKQTRVYTYYLTLRGKADNAKAIADNKKKLRASQQESLNNNPGLKKYKEAHFTFRFIFRSAKDPKVVLLDETYKY